MSDSARKQPALNSPRSLHSDEGGAANIVTIILILVAVALPIALFLTNTGQDLLEKAGNILEEILSASE